MDNKTRELFDLSLSKTKSKVLASSPNGISIELLEHLGEAEYGKIIKISESLVDNFGEKARFSRNIIRKYFNYPKTLPFLVRYKGEIEGFIVGIPLENFMKEGWAHCDENLERGNTIYTYAYIVKKDHRYLGISKMLKRVFQNTLKRMGYEYVTGHVRKGVTKQFTKNCKILRQFENWNNTGYTFEYYRCDLLSQ